MDKRREKAGEVAEMTVIGDVSGKTCIVVDDMVDTAGTLCKAADAIKAAGALSVRACITHPILSGPALENVTKSALEEVLVCDAIALSSEAATCPKFKVLTLAPLIGEAIRRIHKDESVSSLFKN